MRTTVWDCLRAPIREFADAIASEPGKRSPEKLEQELLDAIWRGEFSRGEKSFVTCPDIAESSVWSEHGTIWRDEDGNYLPMPFPEVTREFLRDAAYDLSNAQPPTLRPHLFLAKPHGLTDSEWRRDLDTWQQAAAPGHDTKPDAMTATDWVRALEEWEKATTRWKEKRQHSVKKYPLASLVGLSPARLSDTFQRIYPSLLIETDAVRLWLNKRSEDCILDRGSSPSPQQDSAPSLQLTRKTKGGRRPGPAHELDEEIRDRHSRIRNALGRIKTQNKGAGRKKLVQLLCEDPTVKSMHEPETIRKMVSGSYKAWTTRDLELDID